MTETKRFAHTQETEKRSCGHYCRSGMCVIIKGRCHCGGCANEAVRRGLTLAPGNAFGYA